MIPILEQLETEYSRGTKDWCAATTGTMQERIIQINEQLSKHHKYRERFVQGCTYAQKTSELFLK